MFRGRRLDRDVAEADLVADFHLADVREAPQQAPRAAWDDDRHARAERSERPAVEVVEVHVRDQCRRQVPQRLGGGRHTPPQVEDVAPQDGVRQQASTVQLDQDGRVPDVDEPGARGYAVPAASVVASRNEAILAAETPGYFIPMV
jgi:hypothetical protein